jgi:hypothetical protein
MFPCLEEEPRFLLTSWAVKLFASHCSITHGSRGLGLALLWNWRAVPFLHRTPANFVGSRSYVHTLVSDDGCDYLRYIYPSVDKSCYALTHLPSKPLKEAKLSYNSLHPVIPMV